MHWKSWHETYKGLIPEKYLENITLENCIEMAYRWPQNTLILKKDNEVIGFSCYGDNDMSTVELKFNEESVLVTAAKLTLCDLG